MLPNLFLAWDFRVKEEKNRCATPSQDLTFSLFIFFFLTDFPTPLHLNFLMQALALSQLTPLQLPHSPSHGNTGGDGHLGVLELAALPISDWFLSTSGLLSRAQ